tara:strand:- start:694 stop:1524 length:831 start_codon:yes stop_codon:yes gene_type:complete
MKYHCVIGYGSLGRKIFEALSKKDEKIKIFNRSQKKLLKVNSKKKFRNTEESFKNSKIIFFILKDHSAINYFFNKIKNKKFLQNRIFVNLSTITYKNAIKFSEFAKKNKSKWIEAPTLGNPEALKKRKMFFLYSGPKNKIVIKILNKIGYMKFYKKIHYPQILKIIHNAICANIMISLGDAFLISKKNNIKNKIMFDMILNSGFVSPLVTNKINKIKSGYKVSFAYKNMLKDLGIFKNSKFNYTEILSKTYQKFKKFNFNTKNKDSSLIIKKISKI